jgi:hypothetical protein
MKLTVDIKELWKKHKGWVVLSIFGFLSSAYYFSVDVIKDYNHRVHIEEFKADMAEALKDTAIVNGFFNNPAFLATFFNNPNVIKKIDVMGDNIEKEIHDNIVDAIKKSDTNKVSSRSYVAKELEIRDEAYLPLLVKALKAVKEEENVTKKEVKGIIRREVKPEARRVPVF